MSRRHPPPPVCPYCEKVAKLVPTDFVHGTHMAYGEQWVCRPCDASVGCHKGTTRPKGSLANKALRQARIRAHGALDPLWKPGGGMERREAYAWLAEHMGVDGKHCHIGMFDIDQCSRVVMICDWWRDGRRAAA